MRHLLRLLLDVAFAIVLVTAVVGPVTGHADPRPPITEGYLCLEPVPPALEVFPWLNDAVVMGTPFDDRASLTLTLTPVFEGPRDFNEPAAFEPMVTHSWDFTPLVEDDVPATVIDLTDPGEPDPLVLSGGASWGMGSRAWEITIGGFETRWKRFRAKPLEEANSMVWGSLRYTPFGFWPTVLNAEGEVETVRAAGESVRDGYREFQQADSLEQSVIIGKRATDTFAILSVGAKGTGVAFVDKAVAKWWPKPKPKSPTQGVTKTPESRPRYSQGLNEEDFDGFGITERDSFAPLNEPAMPALSGSRTAAAATAISPDAPLSRTPTFTAPEFVVPTQAPYEGTIIPRSFELRGSTGSVWVHPNATKHLAEYANGMLERGVNPELAHLGTTADMQSLRGAVEAATASGVPYGRIVNYGGWELKFGPARKAGGLPALIHARRTE